MFEVQRIGHLKQARYTRVAAGGGTESQRRRNEVRVDHVGLNAIYQRSRPSDHFGRPPGTTYRKIEIDRV